MGPPTFQSKSQLSEYAEKMSKVARVATAISLQAGLVSETIPIDDAVAELLNFGSAKVSDVKGFKQETVVKATEKLKKIDIDSSSEATDVEKKVLAVKKICKQAKDLPKLEGLDSYFSKIAELEDGPLNYTVLSDDIFKSALENFTSIEGLPDGETKILSDDELLLLSPHASALRANFKNIVLPLTSLKYVIGNFSILDEAQKKSTALTPVETMSRLIRTRKSIKVLAGTANFEENVDKVTDLSKSFRDARKDLESIGELLTAQLFPGRNERKFTIGLAKGLPDLHQFLRDLNESWVQETLGKFGEAEEFKEGFRAITMMENQMSAFRSPLARVFEMKLLHSSQKLSQLRDYLFGSSSSDDIKETFAFMNSCFRIQTNGIGNVTDKVDSAIANAKELKTMITSVKNSLGNVDVGGFDKIQKTLTLLHGIITGPGSTDSKNFPGLFKKLKAEEGLKGLIQFLKTIVSRLDAIQASSNGTTLQSLITKISSEKDVIADFRKNQMKDETRFHECLLRQESRIEKLSTTIRSIEALRTPFDKAVSDVQAAAKPVEELKKELAKIQTLPAELKKAKTVYVEAMNKMPDSLKVSTDIGRAVQAIRQMDEFSRMRDLVEILQKEADFVAGRLAAVSQRKRRSIRSRSEIEQKWGNHSAHLASLKAVLAQIDEFSSKIDLSALSDSTTLMAAAQKIGSVQINLMDKSEALELLAAAETDSLFAKQLREVKETVDKLANLNLEFANFRASFAAVPPALKALSDFLSEWSDSLALILSSTSLPPSETSTDLSWIWWVASAVGVLSVIGVAVFLTRCIRRRRREKKEKEEAARKTREAAEAHARWLEQERKADTVKDWNEVLAFVIKISFKNTRASYFEVNAWLKALITRETDPHTEVEVPEKCRHAIKIYPEHSINTLLKLPKETFWYHANEITTKDGQTFCVAQSPMAANVSLHKEDNRPDFWKMVYLRGTGVIVHCGDMIERNVPACDEYCPPSLEASVTHGCITIKHVADEEVPFQNIIGKVFEISSSEKPKVASRKVFHYQIKEWREQERPESAEIVCKFLELVNVKRKESGMEATAPVLFHSKRGCTRSTMLVAIEYIASYACRRTTESPEQICLKLRQFRVTGNGDGAQTVFVLHAVTYKLYKKYLSPTAGPAEDVNVSEYTYYQKQLEVYPELMEVLVSLTDNRIRNWWLLMEGTIKQLIFENHDKTYAFLTKAHKEMLETPVPSTEVNQRKGNRKGHGLVSDTAVIVRNGEEDVWIDANQLVTVDYSRFIVTQVPKDGRGKDEDSTIDDFWRMVFKNKAEFIVQLCQENEDGFVMPVYFPDEGLPMNTGNYNIAPVSSEQYDGVITRIMSVEDKSTKLSRTVTHLQDTTWTGLVPSGPAHACLKILNTVTRSEYPILVVCETGSGRSMAFVGIEVATRVFERQPKTPLSVILSNLYKSRSHSLDSMWYIYFIVYNTVRKLCQDYEVPEDTANLMDRLYNFMIRRHVYGEDRTIDPAMKKKINAEVKMQKKLKNEKKKRRAKEEEDEAWRRRIDREREQRQEEKRAKKKQQRKDMKLKLRKKRGDLSDESEARHKRHKRMRVRKAERLGRRVSEADMDDLNEVAPDRP